MENIKETYTYMWYTSKGWKILNEIIIDLTGLGIGEIPITNLEFVPDEVNYKLLSELISADGCKARYDANEVDVYLSVR